MEKKIRRSLLLIVLPIMAVVLLLLFNIINIDAIPDSILKIIATIGGVLLTALTGWESYATVQGWQLPEPEEPPTSDKVIHPEEPTFADHFEATLEKIEEAEDFSKHMNGKANGRVKIAIDIEEPEDDDE